MEKEFSFIIAKVWNKEKPVTFQNLGVYRYFEDIHTNTLVGAKEVLEYARKMSPDSEWKIYPVNLGEPLDE